MTNSRPQSHSVPCELASASHAMNFLGSRTTGAAARIVRVAPLLLPFVIAGIARAQLDGDSTSSSPSRLYYAARLIGALLVATLVPLVIDRSARNSRRVEH
jgi:hypothetical protein